MTDSHDNPDDLTPDEISQALGSGRMHALQLALKPEYLIDVQKVFQLAPGEDCSSLNIRVPAPKVALDVMRLLAVALAADEDGSVTKALRKVSDLHDRVLLTEDEEERDVAEYAYHRAASKVASLIGFDEDLAAEAVSLDLPHLDALVVMLLSASSAIKHHAAHHSEQHDDGGH